MKEFSARELLKAGFIRREDLDFRDGGVSFKGYEYNGLPLTYLRANNRYYAALRIDYLKELNYEEYSKMESYELAGEFNGCDNVDINKLVANAEAIISEYAELVSKLSTYEVDMDRLAKQAKEELDFVLDFVKEPIKVDLLNNRVSSYDIAKAADYAKSLKGAVERTYEMIINGNNTPRFFRLMEYSLNRKGFIQDLSDDSFYIREIKSIRGDKQ